MKNLLFLIFTFLSTTANADEIPNKNDEGMKKVNGFIANIDQVDTSRKGGPGPVIIGNPVVDLGTLILDGILNTRTNYPGFPIYQVKISDTTTLNIGSHESFKIGDCVLAWYDKNMGENPDLSMPGQAGIEKSDSCSK
jgi:hypothetical protein